MYIDWTIVKLDFMNGNMTHQELADKYNTTRDAVSKRASREGWEEQKAALAVEVTEIAQEQISLNRAWRLVDLNNEDLVIAKAIKDKALIMVQNARSAFELKAAAGAAEIAQKIGRLALGAETESSLVKSIQLPASVDEFV